MVQWVRDLLYAPFLRHDINLHMTFVMSVVDHWLGQEIQDGDQHVAL